MSNSPYKPEPAVQDTVDRMRQTAERLQNGHCEDLADIGLAVGDICGLLANIVEQGMVTRNSCELSRAVLKASLEQDVARTVEKKIQENSDDLTKQLINWPTAAVIGSLVLSMLTIILRFWG